MSATDSGAGEPTWTDNFTYTGRCGHTVTVTNGRGVAHDCATPDADDASGRAWRGIRCAHESCAPYGICLVGVPYPHEREAAATPDADDASEPCQCGNRRLTGTHDAEWCTTAAPAASTDASGAGGEGAAPGPNYCPTCGACDALDECATRTGRDHPTRRQWSRAWRFGYAAGTSRRLRGPDK